MIVYEQMSIGFRMEKIKLSREGAERKKRLEADHKCLACELPLKPGERVIRGCHDLCYQAQRYAIRLGKVTAAELIRRGEMAAKKITGRKPANAYTAKLLGRSDQHANETTAGGSDV